MTAEVFVRLAAAAIVLGVVWRIVSLAAVWCMSRGTAFAEQRGE